MTTPEIKSKPDYFSTPEECEAAKKGRANTNPRYKFFKQTHFTAGDEDQFESNRDPTNGILGIRDIPLEHNVWTSGIPFESRNENWAKYRNLNPEDIRNTFLYLFYKFKKGIFVKIKNGKLGVFLPFSNKNFVNEWSDRIDLRPKGAPSFMDLLKKGAEQCGYVLKPERVNTNVNTWYANNSLVRYEFPVKENDTNVPIFSDMLKTLIQERNIPDMEFFVNRRDFPVLKDDGTEAYDDMYDSESLPLLSHDYPRYCPILSMCSRKGYADIPIPTGDDWSAACREPASRSASRSGSLEGSPSAVKYFEDTFTREFPTVDIPWEERKSIAVFRGSSTGQGVTPDTNPRLKAALLSFQNKKDTDGLPFLDAGITEWNLRPRKLRGSKRLHSPNPDLFPFSLVPRLSPLEQAKYKYLLSISGHVAAFRLSWELSSGSVVLLVKSKYYLWYLPALKPYVHYVPVEEDLSDLYTQISWCKANDKKCEDIAKAAREFHRKYLSREGILDYLEYLLVCMKHVNGVYMYNTQSVSSLMQSMEKVHLKKRVLEGKEVTPGLFPAFGRSGIVTGVELAFRNGHLPAHLREEDVLIKTRNTKIFPCVLGGYPIIRKESSDPSKGYREAFVGIFGTNTLLRYTPCFRYVFGVGKEGDVYLEKAPGILFRDWILLPEFSMQDYLLILLQISLTLEIAQRRIGFVHYDLMTWNIFIEPLKKARVVEYVLENEVISIKTRVIPVLIDFGFSHVIYKGMHYGSIKPFEVSTVQDILTIVMSSVVEILNFEDTLKKADKDRILHVANFFTGGKYIPRRFENTREASSAFLRKKKFSDLLNSDKYELESKTPYEFYKYILKGTSYDWNCVSSGSTVHGSLCPHTGVLAYELFLHQESEAQIILRTLEKGASVEIPEPKPGRNLSLYRTVQMIRDSTEEIFRCVEEAKIPKSNSMLEIKRKVEGRYVQKFFDAREQDKKGVKTPNIAICIPVFKGPLKSEIFGHASHLADTLESIKGLKHMEDITQEKSALCELLLEKAGGYSIPSEVSSAYREAYKKLLMISTVKNKCSVANNNSLIFYARKIAEKNIETIREYLSKRKPDVGGGVAKMLEMYLRILRSLDV